LCRRFSTMTRAAIRDYRRPPMLENYHMIVFWIVSLTSPQNLMSLEVTIIGRLRIGSMEPNSNSHRRYSYNRRSCKLQDYLIQQSAHRQPSPVSNGRNDLR
jgi:hypothetical protein